MQIRQNQQFCAQRLHAHRRLGLACWGWLLLGSLLWLLELLAAALVIAMRQATTLPLPQSLPQLALAAFARIATVTAPGADALVPSVTRQVSLK